METRQEYLVRIFRSLDQAEAAILELRTLGFEGTDVSVVVPHVEDDRLTNGRNAEGSDTRTVAAAAAGGLLGGLGGWLLGLALFPVPGIGLVLATPVIGAAATGAFLGAGAGTFATALVDMGVEAAEANWYEEQLRAGRTLVTVRVGDRAQEARRVLRYHGGSSPPARAEVVTDVLPAEKQSA